MNGIFILLFLLSIILLPIVVIKPIVLDKITRLRFTRIKAGLTVGVIAFVLFMLVGATASPAIKEAAKTKTTPAQVTGASPSQPPSAPKYIFDVPSLLGKTIDEVRATLGEPVDQLKEPSDQQVKLGAKEWDNTFKKDGKELLVTYDFKTRKIVDFFISTDDSSGKTTNKVQLLQLGNLIEGDPKYKIEFVKAIKDQTSFTGVKILPN